MDQDQLTQTVVRELGRHRSRNDIIISVCNSTGMDWKQAEAFVQQVETSQTKAIASRQAPLILALAIVGIIGGLSTLISIGSATAAGQSVPFFFLPLPYVGNVVYLTLGALALAGGLIGILRGLRNAF